MSGWKQKPTCIHLGLMGAILSMGGHDVGHEWVCDCGKVFVVVKTDSGKKLVAKS